MVTATNKTTHFVFPQELLKTIDQVIGKRKRSAFVIEATREKLAQEKFLKAVKETAGAWQTKNHPGLKTKKDLNKYLRNLRKSWGQRIKNVYA